MYYVIVMRCFFLIFSYSSTGCRGRITLNEKNECIKNTEHSHIPDARTVKKNTVLSTIKTEAKTNKENVRNIIAAACNNVEQVVAASLPSIQLMSRMVNRVRNSENSVVNPKNLIELVFDESITQTSNGENFLLYDSGPSNERLLVFGTAKNLDLLKQCDSIYMDGTFAVAPPLFNQLYTIHG